MSKTVEWAAKELSQLVEEGDTVQVRMNQDILELVRIFSEQGHSGFTASYARHALARLLDHKPLTPLTGEEDEWGPVYSGDLQQNLRCSHVFRTAGDNATAYDANGYVFSENGGQSWYTNVQSSVRITFPYDVPDTPKRVHVNTLKEDEDV